MAPLAHKLWVLPTIEFVPDSDLDAKPDLTLRELRSFMALECLFAPIPDSRSVFCYEQVN